MFTDHLGAILFPGDLAFRYVGRLAFPIFAFFIAEGVIHTSDKLKYFLRVLALALVCQVFYVADAIFIEHSFDELYLNVLFTFALSILVCWSWQEAVRDKKKFYLFIVAVIFSAALCVFANYTQGVFVLPGSDVLGTAPLLTTAYGSRFSVCVDYGFMGIMLPWCAMVIESSKKIQRFVLFSAGICLLSVQLMQSMAFQWLSLLAVPLLWIYDGTRGSLKLKYFFYAFYPLHLAVIYLIGMVI